jgi:hypothetical protein
MRQTEMFKKATLSPAAVANATSAEQTFSVPGLHVGWGVYVNKPTTQAGLVMGGERISAENVLAINFANVTAATITPTASEVYTIVQVQPV